MWALTNHTPFAADRGFARDRDGTEFFLVAVRGAFAIQPDGTCLVAEQQGPVLRGPVYAGEPGQSSLLYDADLILGKRTTDVLLHGHAHAPAARPVSELSVRMRVGSLSKTLVVRGDRVWQSPASTGLSPPQAFLKLPIVYERAFGGSDPQRRAREARNPIGTGFAVDDQARPGMAAPNIEYDEPQPRPAGFGPIPRDWSPRLELAGTYDTVWAERRKPLVPEDFDDRFYQAAPADQQTASFLRGEKRSSLDHLTPEGKLRFRLPRVPLVSVVTFGRSSTYHSFDLHTVGLEPEAQRVILVWHLRVLCHHNLYDLREARVFLKTKVRLGTKQPVEPGPPLGPAQAAQAPP